MTFSPKIDFDNAYITVSSKIGAVELKLPKVEQDLCIGVTCPFISNQKYTIKRIASVPKISYQVNFKTFFNTRECFYTIIFDLIYLFFAKKYLNFKTFSF